MNGAPGFLKWQKMKLWLRTEILKVDNSQTDISQINVVFIGGKFADASRYHISSIQLNDGHEKGCWLKASFLANRTLCTLKTTN